MVFLIKSQDLPVIFPGLGVLVTGAYPGNAASRHQLRGRLRRLGQRRKAPKGGELLENMGKWAVAAAAMG